MLPPGALEIFFAPLDERTRARLGGEAGAQVEAAWAAARAAWPAIAIDAARFCALLGERVARLGELPAAHAGDLYLACACLDGDGAALRAFDALLDEVGRKLERPDNRQNLDEARQLVRQVVLARGSRPAPLDDYAGRGALGGWLRVALARELVRLGRQAIREPRADTGELAAVADAADDPETRYLKTHYGRELKAAFAAALDALDEDARRALRYALVERLSIDEIARLDGVHRATAARQVASARARLAKATRHALRERLRVDGAQLDSILRLVDSQVDVSVRRLLAG